MSVARPALRYHGGKWKLAPWIVSVLPPHRVYVEPFGGAASVLIQKPRSYGEVYNELSDDVVNLFRVLRDPVAQRELIRGLRRTPFSRLEFEDAYKAYEVPVARAKALIIRSFMGFGSNGHNIRVKTGFRANANRSGTTPAQDWPNYRRALPALIRRLEGVVIEHRDAVECMRQHDGPDVLHYVDPPYVLSTRSVANPYDLKYRAKGSMHRAGCYDHEMTDEQHIELLAALQNLTGMVVLSGYRSGVYNELPWRHIERESLADGAKKRTEVLWFNAAAWAASPMHGMFAEATA
ncbi:MAG: DNA adenine methylase [Acidobacteria bacterium]|nr:DNA adenine methylase [Acidobacteriota bacterium]